MHKNHGNREDAFEDGVNVPPPLPQVRHRTRPVLAASNDQPRDPKDTSSPSPPPQNDPVAPSEKGPDYAVGYGRPPAHSRFKKGERRNPNGRPKKSRSTRTMARDTLDETLPITVNGRRQSMSTRQAIIEVLRKKALGGDIKAMDKLLAMAGETNGADQDVGGAAPAIAPPDAAELEILAFRQRQALVEAGLTEPMIKATLATMGLPDPGSEEPDHGPPA